MDKFFNTAGPVNQPEHYKIEPLHRWDLNEIMTLITQRKYFILHAPRQTGKTSSLLALADYLNAGTEYHGVYANIESAQTARNDVYSGIGSVIQELYQRMKALNLVSEPLNVTAFLEQHTHTSGLSAFLTEVCTALDRPLVLLIDEIDALIGDTLVSVLRQLRSNYDKRPGAFPSTIVLCGVRDIKDYRIHKSDDQIITGGSAFNIKAKSLRLGNFSPQDIRDLLLQHTESTGQEFDNDCFDLVWRYTQGQPWLVNALAHEVTYEMQENRNRQIPITAEKITLAKERLVLSRQTHLDQLADKLSEDRVRRVILPMILGEDVQAEEDDKTYCVDLGLISRTAQGLEIANEIYREIIPRELSKEHQDNLLTRFQPQWLTSDGSLDPKIMLSMFQEFWRENSSIWASHIAGYQEAAPHLVTQAFLQRVINGKGSILREYALGRGRTDLMILWPIQEGSRQRTQKIVLELKIFRTPRQLARVLTQGLEQTANYAKNCGTTEAHLLLFDRTAGNPDSSTAQPTNKLGQILDPEDLPPVIPPEIHLHEGISITVWQFR